MDLSLTEQLSQINSAITAIEKNGQEYAINGRKFRRADLSVLYAERRQLKNQLESGNTTTFLRFEGR